MILEYNLNEFVVKDVEIKIVKVNEYYEYDYYGFHDYEILDMEAYRNGTLINIDDESDMSDELWELILENVYKEIEEIAGLEAFFESLDENQIILPEEILKNITYKNYKETEIYKNIYNLK